MLLEELSIAEFAVRSALFEAAGLRRLSEDVTPDTTSYAPKAALSIVQTFQHGWAADIEAREENISRTNISVLITQNAEAKFRRTFNGRDSLEVEEAVHAIRAFARTILLLEGCGAKNAPGEDETAH